MKPYRAHFTLLFLFIFLNLPIIALSQTITGKVIGIADGDTITVLTSDNLQVIIRLYGIDTPESGQAFGNKAKQFTSSLAYGKQGEVMVYDTDRYGRTVGVVVVEGRNVNEEIIKAGYAWQYRKYCKASFCSDWLKTEETARNNKIGLWAEKDSLPPWEWRKGRREGASKADSAGSSNIPSLYHGNIKSHVLHAPGCQHYNCKNCTRRFDSLDEAVRAGYRAHKQCVSD